MFKKISHINLHSLLSFKGALLIGLLFTAVISCKKDMSDADTLQSKMGSGLVSFVQGSNVVGLNGASYAFTPHYIGVPVRLKDAAKSVDTVNASVDASLVAQYNQIYKENNPSIGAETFHVSHQGRFPIASGSAQSNDSLYVVLNDGSELRDSTVYLVPVTLSAKSGSKLSYSVYFFKVFVTKGELRAKMYGAGVINGATAIRTNSGSGALAVYYSVAPDSVKLRVTLNTTFPANDVFVQATPLTDTEIAAAIVRENYNALPSYLPLPANLYTVSKDLATVRAGSLLSRDSITVRFPNKALMPRQRWYVMGMKVKTYAGSPYGVPPTPNDSARIYIRFFL